MAETELDRAEKRFAQAKARLQALRNREATKQRKMDTRRKVILGGALIDLAGRDDRAAEMLERLMRNFVRDQDQVPFYNWDWRAEKRDEEMGVRGDDGRGGVDAKAWDESVGAESPERSGDGAASYGAETDGRAPLPELSKS